MAARGIFENYPNTEERLQAGTAWGVVEAIADAEDHRLPSRVTEDLWVSALFGPRARIKRDGMKAALSLIGIKEGRTSQLAA
jgi:hypothetical protein